MGIRLAVVGAGSSYCPELMQGLIRRKELLPVDELRLTDIDEERLTVVGGFCERALRHEGLSARVLRTLSLEEAVEGTDFVITQIRAGKLDARIRDEKIPLRFGLLGQETTGIGGFVNALRTIPQMERIASAVAERAPRAWLINFTNPSGIVTEYLLNHAHARAIGLCNLPICTQERLARLIGVPTEQMRLETVSLNHCGAVTGVYVGEQNVLPALLAPESLDAAAEQDEWVRTYRPLIELLGAIPNDYLQYFFFRERKLSECKSAKLSRGEVCRDIESRLLSYYADPDHAEIPAMLAERGGHLYSEAAIALIASLCGVSPGYHVLDVQNRGALGFLPDDSVVETCCRVERGSVVCEPVRARPNEALVSLLTCVKAYETLTVRSALSGDRALARRALSCNPLTMDLDQAAPCLAEMLLQSRADLPRFFRS